LKKDDVEQRPGLQQPIRLPLTATPLIKLNRQSQHRIYNGDLKANRLHTSVRNIQWHPIFLRR
jgi:hypothetical protein